MENTFTLSDGQARLDEMVRPAYIVTRAEIRYWDDLLSSRPGAVAPVTKAELRGMRTLPLIDPPVGCVAGWISDEE